MIRDIKQMSVLRALRAWVSDCDSGKVPILTSILMQFQTQVLGLKIRSTLICVKIA